MKLIKKKFRYIQRYHSDSEIKKNDIVPIGFHTGAPSHSIRQFIKSNWNSFIFPNYGFSLYDNPPGKHFHYTGCELPALYRSNEYYNLSDTCFVKSIPLTSMCKDSKKLRSLDLTMILAGGWTGSLDPLSTLSGYMLKQPDTQGGLDYYFNRLNSLSDISLSDNTNPSSLQSTRHIYEEIKTITITDKNGYLDFIYLTSDILTSLKLSFETIRNIFKSGYRQLLPMYQLAVGDTRYLNILSDIFDYSDTDCRKLFLKSASLPLYGIFPGIYGHKDGAVVDLSSGTITGNRKSLSSMLIFLNDQKILDRNDLKYLI